jgi:hypothetical protein
MRVGKLGHAVRKHSHRDDADQLGHGEETATQSSSLLRRPRSGQGPTMGVVAIPPPGRVTIAS